MKCINCNSELADGIQFCPHCGNPLTYQQKSQHDQFQQVQQGQYQQPYQGQYQHPQQAQYQRPYQGQYPQYQESHSQPSNTGTILKVVEYLFYLLGVLDFCLGRFFEIDITGFSWSPLLLTLVGAIIGQYVKKKYGITDED